MTPQENARKNFDRYNKLKRTCEALQKLTVETKEAIEHLESIRTALDIALSEEDLVQIKEELTQYGYIRRKHAGKKVKITSRPLHFLSGDGYQIYVGKNNFQNEELTFKFASDRTYEEAARLAAHYSANSEAEKTEIDYVQKKHVKKVNGKLPGFVIYHTNYSMLIDSDISEIEQII